MLQLLLTSMSNPIVLYVLYITASTTLTMQKSRVQAKEGNFKFINAITSKFIMFVFWFIFRVKLFKIIYVLLLIHLSVMTASITSLQFI